MAFGDDFGRIWGNKKPTVPEYGADFFKKEWFENWEELKQILYSLVESNKDWRSVLDFGCGPGVMIDYMVKKGFDYWGYDPSPHARELYLKHYGQNQNRYLSGFPSKAFDLLLSFDVFEHMKDSEINDMLKRATNIPVILANINRTRGIAGHINLKTDDAWCGFFRKRGRMIDILETERLRQLYRTNFSHRKDEWDRNMFVFRMGRH